jgi:hypothetical protein
VNETTEPRHPRPEVAESDPALEDLLTFIRDSRSFDFTGYKRTSLARRIRKRMDEAGITSYTDYRDRLESNAEEFGHLFNTILINVTSFFRDAEAWAYLRTEILPVLLATVDPAGSGARAAPAVRKRTRWRSCSRRRSGSRSARTGSRSTPPTLTRRHCSTGGPVSTPAVPSSR